MRKALSRLRERAGAAEAACPASCVGRHYSIVPQGRPQVQLGRIAVLDVGLSHVAAPRSGFYLANRATVRRTLSAGA